MVVNQRFTLAQTYPIEILLTHRHNDEWILLPSGILMILDTLSMCHNLQSSDTHVFLPTCFITTTKNYYSVYTYFLILID